MNAELTELVFILDRSGSMGGLESDTIGGFNSMIAKQKAQGKKINVTTVLFDDEVDMIHDRFPVEMIGPLTEEEYFVRGCTALLDAVNCNWENGECAKTSSGRSQSWKNPVCDYHRWTGKFQ